MSKHLSIIEKVSPIGSQSFTDIVISRKIPIPLSLRERMIFVTSLTLIGSTPERLIQKEKLRRKDQSSCDLEPASFTATESVGFCPARSVSLSSFNLLSTSSSCSFLEIGKVSYA